MSEKKISPIKILKRITPLVFKATPFFFGLFIVITILHGLSWAVKILFLQKFYDTTSEVINTGGSIKTIYISLIVYGVVIILAELVNALNNFLYLPFNQKVIGKLMQKVHLKISKIGAIEYENASTLDSINKAEMGINNIFNMVFSFIMMMAFFLPYVLFARGINRDSKVIVLDEPTAAIDPIEETKIYKKFKEISDERTTVLVTHRLGSARIADRIVVMENGRVAEIGTHDELINKKGTYYVLFMSQAQWYENQNA